MLLKGEPNIEERKIFVKYPFKKAGFKNTMMSKTEINH